MFGQVASLLVTDEALVVPHVLHSFSGREIDLVNIHGVGVPRGLGIPCLLGQWNTAAPSTSELSESYHISVELSCFVKPLFPSPASLFLSFREGSGVHHDSKLVGYPLLEGIHQDAIKVDPTAHLSQSEGSGVFVKVTIELVHA